MHSLRPLRIAMLTTALLAGCSTVKETFGDAEEKVDKAVSSEVDGRVEDDRGEPVEGVTVRLYDLLHNTDFVEGSDLGSLEAYIDREAVLASDNYRASATSDAEGKFVIEDVAPGAFLAVAVHASCAAGFEGFDEDTGILNLDTLIKPKFENGLSFTIPAFSLACAWAPEVGPDGNSDEAPPFEPPPPPVVSCDATACEAEGGMCDGAACVLTCTEAACAESGGECVDGACVPPACNAEACSAAGGSCDGDSCAIADAECDPDTCMAARGSCSDDGMACDIPPCFAAEADCTAAGGECSEDGSVCRTPVCTADEDCQAAQPGGYCKSPGDLELASCEPPLPAEIVPPAEALGFTGLRVMDGDTLLADASADNQHIAAADIPGDGLVRVYADYDGSATTAYLQVQSGGQSCPNLPPRTDFIAVELVDGHLASSGGDYLELVLHGGYQKLQLTTSEVLGEGERSFVVEIGEPCAPPEHAFVAILTWDAGPGQPADLDLAVWNGDDELVCVGKKDAAWGRLAKEGKGPGPEVFEATDASQAPFLVKVQFFSGRPRDITGKVRILRTLDGQRRDETFTFTVSRPKDVAVIGAFEAE